MVHPLISQFVTNQVDFIVTRLFDDWRNLIAQIWMIMERRKDFHISIRLNFWKMQTVHIT